MAARPGGSMNPFPVPGRYEPGYIPKPVKPGTLPGRKPKPNSNKEDGGFYGHLYGGQKGKQIYGGINGEQ